MHKCQVLGLYLVPVQYDIDWVIGLFRSETIVPPPFFCHPCRIIGLSGRYRENCLKTMKAVWHVHISIVIFTCDIFSIAEVALEVYDCSCPRQATCYTE